VVEWSPALEAFGRAMGARVTETGGAALFVDYGRDEPSFGDTLQAVRGHGKEGPLENPGQADLTAHVDFRAFIAAAEAGGACATPILAQGEFLRRLGIDARARTLVRGNPGRALQIERQLDRLVAPGQMGKLFKVACVHAPGLAPPGFELG